ncbi:MAG: efflux RND transporter periplasmic adaptor subunit [Burkholderiales bacterium]|nr:efflux RND transporter periplasmic adaptor subunit [Burkholderiales bacterium]
MKRHHLLILVAIAVVGAGSYGLYRLGTQRGMGDTSATDPASAAPNAAPATKPQGATEGEAATRRHIETGLKAGDTDPVSGKSILYYHDPMVPGNKFDRPGKSPFMDMMLVPVFSEGESDQGKVTVSSRIQQNLGVRTAEVIEGMLAPQVSAVGGIAFNERDQAVVQTRTAGFVERLYVRATLDRVAKGQPLVDLYFPDWIAAQEEFLAVRRMQGADLVPLVDGARQRMLQAGMSEAQIALVESTDRTQPRITLAAPIGGVVVELMVREGMTVMSGTPLFRINGLGTVWANAQVPESQSALLRPGAKVQARSPAVPGVAFDGKVQAILPEVDPVTRTLKARMELANPGGRLVPGMFVQMQFMDMRADKAVLVPTEAIIQTGKRTVVMLAEDGGRFRPVDVGIGIETGGQTEIRRGLRAGQRVVVSSQFLIDSEASLRGVEARLNDAPPSNDAKTVAKHAGEATLEAIARDSVTLSHGPIASLQWGPMTMDFKLPASGLPRNVERGDRVSFEFYLNTDGAPQLTAITPLAPESKSDGSKP